MRIKSIHINNFLSFEKADISLAKSYDEEPSIYIIDGINLDSNDSDNSSNGAGKSVLIGESIMYNIYGRGLRAPKQRLKLNDMIRNGCEKMENLVEYFIQQDDGISELTISRSKLADGNSTTKLSIDGDEITKRIKRLSDKDIKTFISLDADVFSQVIVFYHDNANLLSMNYGDRADFFKKIIDLTIIEDYYNTVREFKLANEKIIYQLEIKQKSTHDIIEAISSDKSKYENFVKNRIDELNKELELLNKVSTDVDIDSLNSTVDKFKNDISDERDKYSEIVSKINYENSVANNIKNEIKKINGLSGGKCPTCNQSVPKEYADLVIKEYSSKLEKSVENIAEYVKNRKSIDDNIKLLDSKINEITDKINSFNTEEIIRKNKILNINTEINKLQNDLLTNVNKKDESNDVDKYEKRYAGITKALEIRNVWQEDAEYWYNMFAPKSLLRGAIIKKYINILSDMFEYYVSSLYNNEVIGKIVVNDDNVNNTQIDIILFKNSFEVNYWQLSSGEKKRIDISMMLALYEFTSYLNPNTPKYVILDEIFDSLDLIGRQAVMEILLDMQSRHGIDIFMISHIQIPMEVIPDTVPVKHILVTKKEGISTAKIMEGIEDE